MCAECKKLHDNVYKPEITVIRNKFRVSCLQFHKSWANCTSHSPSKSYLPNIYLILSSEWFIPKWLTWRTNQAVIDDTHSFFQDEKVLKLREFELLASNDVVASKCIGWQNFVFHLLILGIVHYEPVQKRIISAMIQHTHGSSIWCCYFVEMPPDGNVASWC